jgi:transposase
MYIRLKSSKHSKNPSLQIVEGIREGKKVRQRVVASLGVVSDKKNLQRLLQMAENLIQKLKEQGLSIPSKVEVGKLIHTNTIYDGFATVVGKLMDLTGFSEIAHKAQGRHKFNVKEIVKLITAQRLHLPSSKLRTYERQELHGFEGIDLQHIYRAMDAIESFSDEIQHRAFNAVCAATDGPVDCFFFDVTTLHFESVQQDDLRDFGFSKDQKFHSVQIVLALVVNNQGIPLAYETFRGNLAETKTLIPVLTALRSRFAIQNVTVVCDRGMASRANVHALQEAQFHFVIATKLRSISKKLKLNDRLAYVLLPNQENLPEDEQILFRTLEHPQYPDTLLIATYSASRAAKDREDRERLLEKLRERISEDADEASLKKVISNGGYKKYTTIKPGSSIALNQEAIEADAAWDGFHGIAVSNSAKLSPSEALARYRELWHVEEAFRVAKSSLKTRPIFHWVPHRIRCHVLLCFMALFFERFLEFILRKNGSPLTPDRIRLALSGIHTVNFREETTQSTGKIESSLSEDGEKVFKALGISCQRRTKMDGECCA